MKRFNSSNQYLGEELIDITTHPDFKNYSTADFAMVFIERYGHIDGDHHKMWVMDQVARILKGTPVIVKLAKWSNGHEEYRYQVSEETSDAYNEWRVEMLGEFKDGEYEYDYDEGISP